MAGKRIRCDCGTVFDPGAHPACPACGTSPSAAATATQSSANDARVDGAAQSIQKAIAVDPSQARKKMIIVGLGAAVLIAAAFALRPKNGDGKTPASSGGTTAGQDDKVTPSESGNAGAGSTKPPPQTPTPAPAASGLAAFKGTWKLLVSRMQPEAVIPGLPVTRTILPHTLNAAFSGAGALTTLTINDAGSYTLNVDITGDGTYTSNITPDKYQTTVAAQGVLTFRPGGAEVSDRTRATLWPVKYDQRHSEARINDTHLSLLPPGTEGGSTSSWYRPADSGREHGDIIGTWSASQEFIDSYIPYRGTLELEVGGNYRIRFTRSEHGMLIVKGEEYEFKRSIAMGPPVQGIYAFDGPNRFTLTEPRGTATWVRE